MPTGKIAPAPAYEKKKVAYEEVESNQKAAIKELSLLETELKDWIEEQEKISKMNSIERDVYLFTKMFSGGSSNSQKGQKNTHSFIAVPNSTVNGK